MLSTECLSQFHHAANFNTKSNATRAVDTPAHLFGGNEWADILAQHNALIFLVARCAATITNRQVLQLTLPTLVAYRTIQRMIDQQKLHHTFLRLNGLLGCGKDFHPFCYRRCASGQWLRRLLHLDQAHTTIGCDRQFLVVAEMRNINTQLVRCLYHRAPALHLKLLTVNFNVNHYSPNRQSYTRQRLCSI